MSFCPTNDIHSVYLDNELPKQFKADYEKHIQSCSHCQKELEKMKSVRKFLQVDAKGISPDSHYLDQSFERLRIKMAYSKTTTSRKPQISLKNLGYVAMGAAAVLAFAFIVPSRSNSGKFSSQQTASLSVPYVNSANNVSFDSGRSVVISGNIGDKFLSSVSNNQNGGTPVVNYVRSNRNDGFTVDYQYANGQRNNDMIRNVDVLRPDFMEEKTISIKVTFPGMYDGPISPDMLVPEIVITGSFE